VGIAEASAVHGATLSADDSATMNEARDIAEATARYRTARARMLSALREMVDATVEHRDAREQLNRTFRAAGQPNHERTLGRAWLAGEADIRNLSFRAQELGMRPQGMLIP
jgi:hypothetical protein